MEKLTMKIPQSVRDEIAKGPLAHLTTLNKDGSPQVTVVWVGIEGEEFVIGYPGASSEDQEHPARRTRSAVLHRPEHQQGRNARIRRKTTYANFRNRAHTREFRSILRDVQNRPLHAGGV